MSELRPCNLVLFTGPMDWTGVTILFFLAEASSAARLLSGHFKPKQMHGYVVRGRVGILHQIMFNDRMHYCVVHKASVTLITSSGLLSGVLPGSLRGERSY